MYSTYYKSGDSSRSMISTFGGINRRARIGDGESADMQNLSSDAYPLLCPRKARAIAQKQLYETVTETVTDEEGNETAVETTVYKSLNGILGDVGFCAVWGSDFYYMGEKVDGISLIDGEKRLLAFGAYILIYPDQVYYNTANGESGAMETVETVSGTATVYSRYFKYKTSDSRVTEDKDGIVRIKVNYARGNGGFSVNSIPVYDQNSSSIYPSFYTNLYGTKSKIREQLCIRIQNGILEYISSATIRWSSGGGNGTTETFRFEDVEWSTLPIEAVTVSEEITATGYLWNGDFPIKISGTTVYLGEVGNLSTVFSKIETSSSSITAKYNWTKSNLPRLDYVCVLDNRLWGCRYGAQSGSTTTVNEIYCSALGDFKNWTTGTTADSAWRASVGAYGKWTGCVAMNGRVLFFKDDKIFRVSGTKPANFQYTEISETGLQSGCERSMSIIDGALFYKSRDGVYVYDGSTPERISDKLGDAQQAKGAAAGSLYGKYYIALDGVLYVYDTRTGLWHKEDDVNARIFARYDGSLYAAVDQSIVCLSGTPSGIFKATEAEGRFDWYAESGDIGLDSPDQKYYKRILIRAEGAVGSDMTVTVETDGEVQSVTDYAFDRKGTVVVPIITPRCDHMRYRIGGHGDVKIFSISFETETVGDTPERR